MKKLVLITLLSLVFSPLVLSQPTGNGTLGSPYTGTLSSNTTWLPDTYPDRVIYAMNITIASNVTLTVSPGAFNGGHVQFLDTYVLAIDLNGTLIINPQTSMTVPRIINNGTIRLESDVNEAGAASLLHRQYQTSGGGVFQTRLFLRGGTTTGGNYIWHYISAPTSGVNATLFTTQNLAQYIESLVTGADNYPGWVAYDGYQYSSQNIIGNTFSVLELGKGYNYYSASNSTFTISGSINISDIVVPVTSGTGYPGYQGFNLIGNPFGSSIDWDYVISNYPPASVDNAIYFTSNGGIASYVGGIGDNGGTQYIPPMQGFFVKANSNSTVSLPSAARTHEINQMRFKKKSTDRESASSDTISYVRLKMVNSIDGTDLVVRFNRRATTGVDKEYDSYEFSKTSGDLNIWSTTENVHFGINGLPFPTTTIEVPVGLNITTSGIYKLYADQINKLDNYSVILKDLSNNTTKDLKRGEMFEFTLPKGTVEGRFVLVISKSTAGIEDLSSSNNKFRIYSSGGMIFISPLTDDFINTAGSVTVYDISGRKVLQKNKVEWGSSGTLNQFILNTSCKGLHIVEVNTGNMKLIKKVHIMQ